MVAGSTAPPLEPRFVVRGNGLVVPARSVPMPIDLVGVSITAAEAFGVPLLPAVVEDNLERISFTDVLGFVAGTLAQHRMPGVPMIDTDTAFAQQWLAGPALEPVLNLLGDPKRRLVLPLALYVLVKMAARCCPDAVLPGFGPGPAGPGFEPGRPALASSRAGRHVRGPGCPG